MERLAACGEVLIIVSQSLKHCPAGQGMRFRPGTFDGAVSISALQWLCNVDARRRRCWFCFSSLCGSSACGCGLQGQEGARALQAPPALLRAALQFPRLHMRVVPRRMSNLNPTAFAKAAFAKARGLPCSSTPRPLRRWGAVMVVPLLPLWMRS